MRLLERVGIDDLLTWTNEPRIYPRLTFGKHRGLKWSEVPDDYLQWLRDGQHQLEADWRHGAKIELQRRVAKP
jgi:exodeoxyribonuclease X